MSIITENNVNSLSRLVKGNNSEILKPGEVTRCDK